MEVIKYFAKIDDKELGAFNMQELFLLPNLNEETPIWQKDFDNWKPLKETDLYEQFLRFRKEEQVKRSKEKKHERHIKYGVFGLIFLVLVFGIFVFNAEKSITNYQQGVEAATPYSDDENQNLETDSINKLDRIKNKIVKLNNCSKKHEKLGLEENLDSIISYFSFPLPIYFNKTNLTKDEFKKLFKSSYSKHSVQYLEIDSIIPSARISDINLYQIIPSSYKWRAEVYGTFYYKSDNSEKKSRKVHDVYFFDENEEITGVVKDNTKSELVEVENSTLINFDEPITKYVFVVMKVVEEDPFEQDVIYRYKTKYVISDILEINDSKWNEEFKYRLLDEASNQYRKSPNRHVDKGRINSKNVEVFSSYISASKSREKYLSE